MKTELLAPAGSFEIGKAALYAGCDAIYLALESFGARAYAKNFSREELKQIFKGILIDLNLTEKELESIVTLVRTPAEMTKIVDAIEANPNIKYNELFEVVLNSIDFDIEINQ